MRFHAAMIVCLLGITAMAGPAYAQNTIGKQNTRPLAAVAVPPKGKPLVNPLPAPNAENAVAESRDPALVPGASASGRESGEAYGSFGIPYTSKRVSHGATNQTTIKTNFLATTFPYRAIGQLTSSGGNCTASVIKRGIIVTAAHCVSTFNTGSNSFTNFLFTPAYFANGANADEQAPYGVWDWEWVEWPSTWGNGKDTGAGSARNNDLAVIAIRKIGGQHIGDVVGQLNYGWNNYSFTKSAKTGNLDVAAMTTIGYPGLLDSGGRMQRADGPAYLTTVSKALQIWQGNNFTGGSSGGPWIVNFGAENPNFRGNASAGTSPNDNTVIGVTSWGTADPNRIKDNYSSQFAQNKEFPNATYGTYGGGNIGGLLKSLCGRKISGKTLAQLGYCD